MDKSRIANYGFVLAAIALAVVSRLVPHPANVAPVAALALFAGVYLDRRWAMILPLAAMVISDTVIGFHGLIAFTWGCFLISGALGWWVKKKFGTARVVLGSLTGSVIFYLVTNWAVWAYTPLYEKNLSGLKDSYILALPFFRNTVLGDLFFVGVFFGLAALTRRIVQQLHARPTTSKA